MRFAILAFALLPSIAFACDQPVCLTNPGELRFSKLIDFDDVPAGIGLGSRIDSVLVRDGAVFGERFAGQSRRASGDFDVIEGAAFAPLTVIDGGPGQTLGAMRLPRTTVLHGHGPAAHPRVEAIGEGAVAILFDRDQPALAFDIRGGEEGTATVHFLRRDGSLIDSLVLGPLKEDKFAFHTRSMTPEIAGILLLNTDPQGVAIDNLRFESFDTIS